MACELKPMCFCGGEPGQHMIGRGECFREECEAPEHVDGDIWRVDGAEISSYDLHFTRMYALHPDTGSWSRPKPKVIITVNGLMRAADPGRISYEKLVRLARLEPSRNPTVVYNNRRLDKVGFLNHGDTVVVDEELSVTVSYTGNA